MGLKDTIDASNRYAEYENDYKNDTNSKQRLDYVFNRSNPGMLEDATTIYNTLARRLESNNIPITGENLDKAFESLHAVFMEKIAKKDSGMSEQERGLREALGNENEPTVNKKSDEDWGGEQMADLKNLLGGMKEGPDKRFEEDDDVGPLW